MPGVWPIHVMLIDLIACSICIHMYMLDIS